METGRLKGQQVGGQQTEHPGDEPELRIEGDVAPARSGQQNVGQIKKVPGSTTAPCPSCGAEQSAIRINVDGNTLLMESCDSCDIRRWQLAGERIDLQEALNQVGEHSGRRRSQA